ncbi:MAG: hypothetical protein Q9196_004062 [Gyalolechia fulgens]
MDDEETDDSEIKLQRDSAKLLDELKTSIPLFLYKGVEPPRPAKIRKWIKRSNTAKLESLFNAFLESPQLLDPILRGVLEPLVSSFKDYINNHSDLYSGWRANDESTAEPLPRALCRLLYTLCKVRGPKVIVNFFTNEPSILEPMLDAFGNWNSKSDDARGNGTPVFEKLTWEEKFSMLLWLSHLARTPFDLASISSSDKERNLGSQLPIEIPVGLPDVACRLLALGFRYLQSSTKEQEAAKLLLVRLCTRPDMIRFGLHEKCISWALKSLRVAEEDPEYDSVYSRIGSLSFLAGFFSGSDSTIAARFIDPVLAFTQEIFCGSINRARIINGSAVARKLTVKVYRSCAVHLLSGSSAPGSSGVDLSAALSTIVDHLMRGLGDKDSPVRFAASKALSMVARQLDLDMTTQLVDDIIMRLQEDVIQKKGEPEDRISPALAIDPALLKPDTSSVNSLQWQGLILTLSHLLFRHSLPQSCLTTVVSSIAIGLDFEQRSSMGVSVGSGVRDAACFGVWSLARKYTTPDLLQLSPSTIRSRWTSYQYTSVFEVLAAELVVTATLDPEGNIRRAASAALQELVGRHPNMVPDGIALVQIVDYHAVGLRSRAMCTVALQAAKLHNIYLFAVLDGLLSWRAINSPEAAVRRQTASTIGQLFDFHGCAPMTQLYQRFRSSQGRSLSEWHGLHLALAAAIRHSVDSIHYASSVIQTVSPFGNESRVYLLREDTPLSSDNIIEPGKDGSLAAEALCTVITALGKRSCSCIDAMATTDSMDGKPDYHLTILELALKYCTEVPLEVYSDTAVTVFNQYSDSDQKNLLHGWLTEIKERNWIRRDPRTSVSWIAALGSILCHGNAKSPAVIILSLLHERADGEEGSRNDHDMQLMHRLLVDCLNDYSILNSRDVGSQIRAQAIETIKTLDRSSSWSHDQRGVLFARVYGLAAEKTDKVRESAWSCLREFPNAVYSKEDRETLMTQTKRAEPLSTSDAMYFEYLITRCDHHWIRESTILGLITSAGSGNEALIRASRAAIPCSFETLSLADVDLFYNILLNVVREAIPDGRLLRPGLEVLAFLLDVDPHLRLTDSISAWEGLLEVLPLLRKNTDLRILEAMVKIYAGLERYDSLRGDALGSLYHLLAHRFPKIRLAAAAALYVLRPNDRLKALDLSGPVPRIKMQVRAIFGDGDGARVERSERLREIF